MCNSDGYVGQVCILSIATQIQVSDEQVFYNIDVNDVLYKNFFFFETSFSEHTNLMFNCEGSAGTIVKTYSSQSVRNRVTATRAVCASCSHCLHNMQ